jgi:hypothetical protein
MGAALQIGAFIRAYPNRFGKTDDGCTKDSAAIAQIQAQRAECFAFPGQLHPAHEIRGSLASPHQKQECGQSAYYQGIQDGI